MGVTALVLLAVVGCVSGGSENNDTSDGDSDCTPGDCNGRPDPSQAHL